MSGSQRLRAICALAIILIFIFVFVLVSEMKPVVLPFLLVGSSCPLFRVLEHARICRENSVGMWLNEDKLFGVLG